MKKLMVVAHPDDELIFGGSHLLSDDNWTVICVTNAGNHLRAAEFAAAMEFVGADYEIWNYEDTYSSNCNWQGLERDLRRVLRRGSFQKVVTHNLRGEYGHPQHIILSRIMRRLVKSHLYVFGKASTRLPYRVVRRKKKLLHMSYPSQRETIHELNLTKYINRECFRRVK